MLVAGWLQYGGGVGWRGGKEEKREEKGGGERGGERQGEGVDTRVTIDH